MKIDLHDGLPFVSALIRYHELEMKLQNVLLDTGSAATIFSVDKVVEIGLKPEKDDAIERMFGVGGTEFVVSKQIDSLFVGELYSHNFCIQLGMMQYGLEIDGIIGLDFLLKTNSLIDLSRLELRPPHKVVID
ncbi:MAG: hypothetical protein MAG431_01379 [Chloroflexi bacterium]|nr:hypothetical protein [Chloroflexota bacterium]